MTDAKYEQLVEELQHIIISTLRDLSTLINHEDYIKIVKFLDNPDFKQQPWVVLEDLLAQLLICIKDLKDQEQSFNKELEKRKALLKQQNEESLCADDESSKLEKEIQSLKSKLQNLQGVEQKLRSEYILNKTIQDELSSTQEKLSKIDKQNKILENKIISLSEIKQEVGEVTKMPLTVHQIEGFKTRAKGIWTAYTKTPKHKRDNYLALKYSKCLDDILREYEEESADETNLTGMQKKRHQEYHEQHQKVSKRLSEEVTRLGGIPEGYDENEDDVSEIDLEEDTNSYIRSALETYGSTQAEQAQQIATLSEQVAKFCQFMTHTPQAADSIDHNEAGPSGIQQLSAHQHTARADIHADQSAADIDVIQEASDDELDTPNNDSGISHKQNNPSPAPQQFDQQQSSRQPNNNPPQQVDQQQSRRQPNNNTPQHFDRQSCPQPNNNLRQHFEQQQNCSQPNNIPPQQHFAPRPHRIPRNNIASQQFGPQQNQNHLEQIDYDIIALHDTYSKLISRGIPVFDGKGKRNESYLDLKRFIQAMELSWSTAARNRIVNEKLFTQIVVTSKIAGKAFERVVHTNFDTIIELTNALNSEYDLRITVSELTDEIKAAEQHSDEDVTMYANRLRRLLNKIIKQIHISCDTNSTGELINKKKALVSQRFKLGLREPELRQAMTASRESDLTAMEAHCLEIEELLKTNKPKIDNQSPGFPRKFVKNENSNNFNRNIPERRSTERLNFKPPSDYTPKTNSKQCTYCNIGGHDISECFTKDRDEGILCSICKTKGHREKNCKKPRVHFVELEDDETESQSEN